MIISKPFTFTEDFGESVSILPPNVTSKVTHYPALGRFIVDSFNDVLANFNAHIEYNEQTGEAEMDRASFLILAGASSIKIYFNGDDEIGYNSVSFTTAYDFNLIVLVRGTSESFELLISSGDSISSYLTLFGKYSMERLSDGKIITAFRKNSTTGSFWMFEDGVFIGHSQIVKPSSTYAYAETTYSGFALVPAVLTNFAYRVVNVYMFCPMLESGTYYTIAGVSLVSVQTCLLLKC